MKPKMIILYGPMGVGKLTVAKLLVDKTGYLLSHNHLINDLAYSLFERDTVEINQLVEDIRYMLYEKAIQSKKNFIITHTYSHNYVSLTGQSDPNYLQKIEEQISFAGGETYFIHLKADEKVLLERVTQKSRKEFKKLTDVKIMQKIIKSEDFNSSANLKNQLILDTSLLNPSETAKKIIDFIS